MLEMLYRIPLYRRSYSKSYHLTMPTNYTLSITSRCNSRCRTCGIWKNMAQEELYLDNWKRIISSLGRSPVWVTVTGGDQFLREDFAEIVREICIINNPAYINIPIGISREDLKIGVLRKIIAITQEKRITLLLNISIDGTKEMHDNIRGTKGSFDRTIGAINSIKGIGSKNTILASHTTISRRNIDRIDEIISMLKGLRLDSSGFSIAEKREELKNSSMHFMLDRVDSIKALRKIEDSNLVKKPLVRRILNRMVIRRISSNMKKKKGICLAGIASVQIDPQGFAYACPNKDHLLGDLKDNGYDLKRTLQSKQAQESIRKIRDEGCICMNTNAMYTNVICYPK